MTYHILKDFDIKRDVIPAHSAPIVINEFEPKPQVTITDLVYGSMTQADLMPSLQTYN